MGDRVDLKKRFSYPIAREDGGVNVFPASDFYNFTDNGFTQKETDMTFNLLNELKRSCLFGVNGVLISFSNFSFSINEKLTIGKINTIKIPPVFPSQKVVIVGMSKYAAIMGDVQKGEGVFPHLQFKNDDQINLSCSAFDNCPSSFRPTYTGDVYLSFYSNDVAVQVLQKALWEFSQNNANMSIILLYASIEIAVEGLTKSREGKISTRLSNFRKMVSDNELKKNLRKIKGNIEKHIVKTRGDVAHNGIDITQENLLKPFETALEFFWYYDAYKKFSY